MARTLFVALLAIAIAEGSRSTCRSPTFFGDADTDSAAGTEPGGWSVWPIGYLLEHGAERSHCTATLVGPRIILTALHCRTDEATSFLSLIHISEPTRPY